MRCFLTLLALCSAALTDLSTRLANLESDRRQLRSTFEGLRGDMQGFNKRFHSYEVRCPPLCVFGEHHELNFNYSCSKDAQSTLLTDVLRSSRKISSLGSSPPRSDQGSQRYASRPSASDDSADPEEPEVVEEEQSSSTFFLVLCFAAAQLGLLALSRISKGSSSRNFDSPSIGIVEEKKLLRKRGMSTSGSYRNHR